MKMQQSPVNIVTKAVVKDDTLGPVTFKYSSVWNKNMQETLDTPQPTVEPDTGKSWKFDIPTHHQDMIYNLRWPLEVQELQTEAVPCSLLIVEAVST